MKRTPQSQGIPVSLHQQSCAFLCRLLIDMIPRVRQTRHYEMFEWRSHPLRCLDCKTTALYILASGATGILLNMQFVSPWSVFVGVCFNGKSLCKTGICAHCLQFSKTAAFFFFKYAIDSCDNRKHAVCSFNPAAMLYIPEWKCS